MKNIVLPVLLVLVIASCGKWKKDKYTYTYYSEDYAQTDMTLLGVHTSEIDYLWVDMRDADKDKTVESYTLYVKANGTIYEESGTINSDWKTTITFNPTNGVAYTGNFQEDKGRYKLEYDLETRTEELTFEYKEGC